VDSRRIPLALVVYAVVALVAVVWGVVRGSPDLYHHPAPWVTLAFPAGTVLALLSGLAVAAAAIASTRVLVRRTRWARALHNEFRDLLGPLSPSEITVFALSSGIAEEMLFRGALQPAVGLIASALIFGAVHMGPVRRFWAWTLWAAVMGLVFGLLYEITGELLAPVVAHALINYENLHYIDAYDPNRADADPDSTGRTPAAPRLVETPEARAGRR